MNTKLNKFSTAYLTCALWTNDDDAPGGMDYRKTGRPKDLMEKIHPASLARAIADCEKFQSENSAVLALAGDDKQNGHDFWLTRNGHGAGFLDRGYGESVSAALTESAERFGEINCSIDLNCVYIE